MSAWPRPPFTSLLAPVVRERRHRSPSLSLPPPPFSLQVSRKYEDDFSTFHDHDHWPGVTLALLRGGCCAVLWHGNHAALDRAGGYGGPDSSTVAVFLHRFKWLGTAWLLAFPLVVLVGAPLCPHTLRHLAVTVWSVGLQSAALAAMLTLFLGLGASGQAFLKVSAGSAASCVVVLLVFLTPSRPARRSLTLRRTIVSPALNCACPRLSCPRRAPSRAWGTSQISARTERSAVAAPRTLSRGPWARRAPRSRERCAAKSLSISCPLRTLQLRRRFLGVALRWSALAR